MMIREQKQSEALQTWEKTRCGVLVLTMGSGKSKIAIDAIKQNPEFKSILITSPRTNLKENWESELEKWHIYKWDDDEYDIQCGRRLNIVIENIQTVYKWDKHQLSEFDLIVIDEAHTAISPEYSSFITKAHELKISLLGLTGTPELHKPEKKEFYDKYLPILYEYYDSADDGLINKTRVLIYDYSLTNNYKVMVGSKKKQFLQGELDAYNYIQDTFIETSNKIKEAYCSSLISKAKEEIAKTYEHKRYINSLFSGARPEDSADKKLKVFKDNFWAPKNEGRKLEYKLYLSLQRIYNYKKDWSKLGMLAAKSAAMAPENLKPIFYKYIWARDSRKHLLTHLESSKSICMNLLSYIGDNKTIVFSEYTEHMDSFLEHTYHSNNRKRGEENFERFKNGEINILGAADKLTLGVNIPNLKYAVFESFMASRTKAGQKAGRLNRLSNNEVATLIILNKKGTHSDVWLEGLLEGIRYSHIQRFEDLNELIKEL